MARRANVETRVESILDTKRPLARRIGVVGTLLLLAVMIPTVLLSASLRPAEDEATSRTETAAESKNRYTSSSRYGHIEQSGSHVE